MTIEITPQKEVRDLTSAITLDGIAVKWAGPYQVGRTYQQNDAVTYNLTVGATSCFRCKIRTSEAPALNSYYWEPILYVEGDFEGGSSSSIKVPFSFSDATPKFIYSIPADTLIVSAAVIISTPFNSPLSSISLGDSGNNSRLLNSSQIYQGEVGEYETKPMYKYITTTSIYLYINLGSGNTTGNGYVILEI